MRLALSAAAIIALAGCDQVSTGEPSGPLRTDNQLAANANEEAEDVPVTEAGDLPDPGPGPRFVGNWAETAQTCQSAAWRFTDSLLQTPAGASCSFNRITEVDGGYDVQATCTAKGPPAADTLKLRFAESAKALLVESQSIGSTGLVYCGRDA